MTFTTGCSPMLTCICRGLCNLLSYLHVQSCRKAKEEGWRARSAFKLLQIDEAFQILTGRACTTCQHIVCLCQIDPRWPALQVSNMLWICALHQAAGVKCSAGAYICPLNSLAGEALLDAVTLLVPIMPAPHPADRPVGPAAGVQGSPRLWRSTCSPWHPLQV